MPSSDQTPPLPGARAEMSTPRAPGVQHAKSAAGTGSTERSWRIELPAGMPLLSMNGRLHWAQQRRRAADLKQAAWAVTKAAKVPALARAWIMVEYQPPDRRVRDHDNLPAASGKHCIDGIVAAGVLPDDKPPYVQGLYYRVSEETHPRGRLVLVITELPGGQT